MTVDNLTVTTVNVKGNKSSQKGVKHIQYFCKTQTALCFCKRLIPVPKTRMNGKTILRVISFTI